MKVKRVLEKSAHDSEPKKASGLKEETNDKNPNMEKRRRIDLEDCWVKCGAIILTIADKQLLINGHELHDDHVNASQALLSEQFPYFSGFRCTLMQHSFNGWKDNYIQIFHCRGNHWITVSTVGNNHGEVTILDSLYKDVDAATNKAICQVFKMPVIKYIFPCIQVQRGCKDCGLFAIAYATHIAFNKSVNELPHFNQSDLRPQLINYLEQHKINVFN